MCVINYVYPAACGPKTAGLLLPASPSGHAVRAGSSFLLLAAEEKQNMTHAESIRCSFRDLGLRPAQPPYDAGGLISQWGACVSDGTGGKCVVAVLASEVLTATSLVLYPVQPTVGLRIA